MTIQRWGGLACLSMVAAMAVSSWIYLTGNLRDLFGSLSYSLADVLAGPVWAASLVAALVALREHFGERAPRRMSLALLAAFAAAAAFVGVAGIRAANRHHHLLHPELHLEESTTVLVTWTTLVAGVTATGWQFLGWTLLLVGSSGWTTRRLPRALSGLFLVAGSAALVVIVQPNSEMIALPLVVAASIWQGILLLQVAHEPPPAA